MRRLSIILIIVLLMGVLPETGLALPYGFIHPLDFSGSESEKAQVISYIKRQVKETYSKIGMDDPMTLRMMERENLNAFKELIRAKNRSILDDVISTYCGIGMCDYNTINMMYNEQMKANNQSLNW